MSRCGFNGMETDPEVKEGWGQHYTTYFRQYDPRLGRWWSNDPVTHPWESPYAAMYNNPIYFSDASGATGEGPTGGEEPDEYAPPQEIGCPECPECEANVPDPEIGQSYFTKQGWGYNYYGTWLLDPGDEVTVEGQRPEALPGEHRFNAGNLVMDGRAASRLYEDPLTTPGEYYHKGQWIAASEYRAKVQNVVSNIDNPAYDPAQDGFYFGEGSNLQAPFWRLFGAIGERTHGTSNEMLPSGAPNPFAHMGLETPMFAPEAVLAGFAAGWWSGAGRGGAGGLARGSMGASDDMVTLFRGVNETHLAFDDALQGIVKPNRRWWQFTKPKSTPLQHNIGEGGTLNSPYTSWTLDVEVAINYANRPVGNGVVLKQQIPLSRVTPSPNLKEVQLIQSGKVVPEKEVLVGVVVKGA